MVAGNDDAATPQAPTIMSWEPVELADPDDIQARAPASRLLAVPPPSCSGSSAPNAASVPFVAANRAEIDRPAGRDDDDDDDMDDRASTPCMGLAAAGGTGDASLPRRRRLCLPFGDGGAGGAFSGAMSANIAEGDALAAAESADIADCAATAS